jgi:hypothetical protein
MRCCFAGSAANSLRSVELHRPRAVRTSLLEFCRAHVYVSSAYSATGRARLAAQAGGYCVRSAVHVWGICWWAWLWMGRFTVQLVTYCLLCGRTLAEGAIGADECRMDHGRWSVSVTVLLPSSAVRYTIHCTSPLCVESVVVQSGSARPSASHPDGIRASQFAHFAQRLKSVSVNKS